MIIKHPKNHLNLYDQEKADCDEMEKRWISYKMFIKIPMKKYTFQTCITMIIIYIIACSCSYKNYTLPW
jgi:hypothetical protein